MSHKSKALTSAFVQGTPGFALKWLPGPVYVVTAEQLQEWFDRHGAASFYDGVLWKPKVKRVAPGRHSVEFVKVEFVKW